MKGVLLLALSIFFLWPSLIWGEIVEGWVDYAEKKIEEFPDDPSFNEMLTLATFIGVESDEPEAVEVKRKAWKRLQQIPDFADRFAAHLHDKREEWVSGMQSSPSPYYSERYRTIVPMAKLPHPGVVKVLGGFLSDIERPGYDGGNVDSRVQHSQIPSNAVLSAQALGKLIEKPPTSRNWDDYSEADAKTWELWFAQVRAGTRSFRFKGDPQEYNLDGPVSAGVKPTGTEVRRDDAGSSAESPAAKSAKSFPMVALIAACGILAVAILLAVRRSGRKLA